MLVHCESRQVLVASYVNGWVTESPPGPQSPLLLDVLPVTRRLPEAVESMDGESEVSLAHSGREMEAPDWTQDLRQRQVEGHGPVAGYRKRTGC